MVLGSPRAGEIGIVQDLLVDRAFTYLAGPQAAGTRAAGTPVPVPDVVGEATELAALGDLTVQSVDELRWLLGAAALARATGLSAAAVRAGLRACPPAPHRHLGVVDGVAWVDGTGSAIGPEAYDVVTWVLAESPNVPVAGYSAAKPHLRAVLGPGALAVRRHLPGVHFLSVEDDRSAAQLVAQARAGARPGDTILLSGAGLVEVALA